MEVRPGVGTVVAEVPPARAGEKRCVLDQEVEQLVVGAMRVGLEEEHLLEAVRKALGQIGKNGGRPLMIEVHDLWKKFRRHDALRGLSGLSFNVLEGSAYALILIGANGAGKTAPSKF